MKNFMEIATSAQARKFHIALGAVVVAGLQLFLGANNELVTLVVSALTAFGVYGVSNK